MLYRPLVMLSTATGAVIVVLAVIMLTTGYRSAARADTALTQLALLLDFEREVASATDSAALARARDNLLRARAASVDARLPVPADVPKPGTHAGVREIVQAIRHSAKLDWWLLVGTSVVLAMVTVLIAWRARRDVLRPLQKLNQLLVTMTMRRYERADLAAIPQPLRPLFETYNEMVEQVATNDAAQARREQGLLGELRSATRALLQQQKAIAQSEQLAATGELAAHIAHDVRNPLAGILAALDNLEADLDDTEACERIEMIKAEVMRLSRQLTEIVEQVRQRPEPAARLCLAEVISSLLTLTSYQVPDDVVLDAGIDETLHIKAPEGELRHAILNLVLNSVRAIGAVPGRVEVSAERKQDQLLIKVTDTGPGFSEKALQAGTRPFTRFGGRSGAGAAGLGLAAAARLARNLGGELHLANGAKRGAVVTLTLPGELCDA